MDKIAASILGKANQVSLINKLIRKGVSAIHYDLMDGKFVDNLSLPTHRIKQLVQDTEKHIVDIHLMSMTPEQDIAKIIDFANYITFHIEVFAKKKDIYYLLKLYEDKNIGIALNPETKIESVFPFLPFVSHVLVMSVVPGKGGQSFIDDSLQKVGILKKEILKQKLNVFIQIDGGITYEWGPKVINAGADSLVSGSFLISKIDDRDFFKKIYEKKN